MGKPGANFNALLTIAAEDVGLADPTLITYVRNRAERFKTLFKRKNIKATEVSVYPDLCRLIDEAVIAAAVSCKIRLLPQASFATLYEIYNKETFSHSGSEYEKRFLQALRNQDEAKSLYYAYILGIFLNSKDSVLRIIRQEKTKQNTELLDIWTKECERSKDILFLSGCVVLLCRPLNHQHGKFKELISDHLSLAITEAEVPDRAYDSHTPQGRKKGHGLKHFFDEAATVKNKPFENNWDDAGTKAYLDADKEKKQYFIGKKRKQSLAKAKNMIEAIKKRFLITELPFDYRRAVLTQARTAEYKVFAFVVELPDGKRKFMKGPFESAELPQEHAIYNEIKKRLASKYLHPIHCEVKTYDDGSVFLECEELGKANLNKVKIEPPNGVENQWFAILDDSSNGVVHKPFKFLDSITESNKKIWVEVIINYCFRWIFRIGDASERNLMLEKSTGRIYSTDEIRLKTKPDDHKTIWCGKAPKGTLPLVKDFADSPLLNDVLDEIKRWKKNLKVISSEDFPITKGIKKRIDRLLKHPRKVLGAEDSEQRAGKGKADSLFVPPIISRSGVTTMKNIISVSRRTDIPAFYSNWFLNRLKEGYAGDRKAKRGLVSLKPEDVTCFVFWSKNYQPFLGALKFIDMMGYNAFFHFTITGLPDVFETNVVETKVAIETLKAMSKQYSPAHLIWRYDPIVISEPTGPDFHIENFTNLAESLSGHVERCAISFVRHDAGIKKNLARFSEETGIVIADPDMTEKRQLAKELATIAEKYGIQVQVCKNKPLAGGKVKGIPCIDGSNITRLFKIEGFQPKKGSTRKECGCSASVDIGRDNTCPHGCVYCYANVNKEKAKAAYQNHDENSPVLGWNTSKAKDWMAEISGGQEEDVPKTIKKTIGESNILIMAPHGWSGKLNGKKAADDELTAEIAALTATRSNGTSLVNTVYRKPRKIVNENTGKIAEEKADKAKKIVNAARVNQAKKFLFHEFYQPILDRVDDIKEKFGKALVVWVHGIGNENIKEEAEQMGLDQDLDILIGIGQGQPDRFTAREETAEQLINLLEQNEEAPVNACLASRGSRYCGQHKNIMNQMFLNEGYKLSDVESIQLEIKNTGFRDSDKNAALTIELLSEALSGLAEFLIPVQKVKVEDIQVKTEADRRYLFRTTSDDPKVKKRQEQEIQGLADSIKEDGLAHPLLLIENGKGKFRILCGFRRFQALKLLGRKWVDARVYKEEHLTEEERFRISLAENARRKDLNPLEKGIFLRAAWKNGSGKETLANLGKKYGEMLGIGTSHGCVEKYVKLAELHAKGESPEIVRDAANGTLAFEKAAGVLAYIDNAEDRNVFYGKIVKPFNLTRPELKVVKGALEKQGNGKGLKATLESKKVQQAIKKAKESSNARRKRICLLESVGGTSTSRQTPPKEEVDALRKSVYGKEATEKDFNIEPCPNGDSGIFVRFKLTSANFDDTIANVKQVLDSKDLRKIVDTNANSHVKACDKSKKRASSKNKKRASAKARKAA